MSFLESIINSINGVNIVVGSSEEFQDSIPSIISGSGNSYRSGDNISAVYICVRVLSDAISRLPLNVLNVDADKNRVIDRNDPLFNLLHFAPNNYTSSQKFFNTLEHWRNLKGNSFARIYRKNGRPVSLELVPPSRVTGYSIVNNQLYYKLASIKKGQKEETVNGTDILHFTHTNIDGIWGVNPIEKLRLNLSTIKKGQKTIDNFYQNNATTSKALATPSYAPNQKALKEGVKKFQAEYAGPANAGKLLTLPEGASIIDLAMNFADAEFIDTIKFNTGQVSSLYGVPPHLVGLFESTKFNSVEQMGLDFKVNTMASILRMYRQELEFKLLTDEERAAGKSIEFNSNALVETDFKTRIDAITREIQFGMLSPNQANQIEGQPIYDGGELHWSPFNMGFTELRAKEEEAKLKDPSLGT